MIILDFDKKTNIELAISLGFFDSVHIGHRQVINNTLKFAQQNNIKSAVFTFKNNPLKRFDKDLGIIYTFEERCDILEQLGVDYVVSVDFDEAFCNLTAKEFLRKLNDNFCIRYIACGEDYRFGRGGQGDIKLLDSQSMIMGYKLQVINFVQTNGHKVSSSTIRQSIMSGDIISANNDLGDPFHVTGEVVTGRRDGSRIGIPTINISPNKDKIGIKQGVYITSVKIDGQVFRGVTNVGAKPTYNDYSNNIETHIIGFEGNLYGTSVKIVFLERIRDIVKYDTIEQLVKQINADIGIAQAYGGNC